jgi:hypothetical protein
MARAWVRAQPEGPFVQRWERPGYQIPGGSAEPAGLAEEVRRRSAQSPVRALSAVLDVAVRSASAPIEEAFEIETVVFRSLLAAPEFPALGHFFYALRHLADVPAQAASSVGPTVSIREFPQIAPHSLAECFFAPDAPVVEITVQSPGATTGEITDAVAGVRAKGGIPVVIHGGTTSFVQTLLEAGPDADAMTQAARNALDAGLVIDPDGADVASVLAAGFPGWTGGVLHHLST